MNIRKVALSSAAAIGLVATVGLTSVSAHSRHPATADENAQTDQLNQQSLAAAQGGGTSAPAAATSDQGGAGGASTMAPTAPAQNNTGTATPDQPVAPGTAAPNAVMPNTTAPDTTPTPAPSPNDMKTMGNTAAPTAANQDPAAPQPASGIAPKTPQ